MHMATKNIWKKAKKLCLMGQIVIESHSFLEYWQNRKIHVRTYTKLKYLFLSVLFEQIACFVTHAVYEIF